MTTYTDLAEAQTALVGVFTELGSELVGVHSVDAVFRTISHRAFEAIPAAEHAAISQGRKGSFETVAATDDLPHRVDQIQYDLRSGPCVDAIVQNATFRVGDLAQDRTWPEFGRRAAAQHGIRSMLSVRLFLEDDDLLAALNLYSGAVDAFDQSDETVATLLATHGALAVTAARRQDKIDNLERALLTSRRIGIAMGVLMAGHKITDDQAFDLLRIASQASHRKLSDIAEDVTVTGSLDLPPPPEKRRR